MPSLRQTYAQSSKSMRARQQPQHSVEDASAGAHDRDQHDLLAVEQRRGHPGQRRLDGHLVGRQVARDLVSQQHPDLRDEGAELGGARLLAAKQRELVLDQGMIDHVHVARHACLRR